MTGHVVDKDLSDGKIPILAVGRGASGGKETAVLAPSLSLIFLANATR